MIRNFHKMFEPITIGRLQIKNRVAMAPMGIGGLIKADGSPGRRAIDYYVERARGGVGLIITGVYKVENEIERVKHPLYLISPRVLAPFSQLAKSVHSLGAKIFVQLTAGFGRVVSPQRLCRQPVSASPNPFYWDPEIICRELKTEEVETLVNCFGAAAQIIAQAGIDGIELHGHEGYLFDQFATKIWNRRGDRYGGDLLQRLTFPIEVLKEIKGKVGWDFPVQYRFGLKHYMKGLSGGALPGESYVEAGRDKHEGIAMARLLEQAGFDALHVDAGCKESLYWPHPPAYQADGCMVDMAGEVKNTVHIPVITVGRLKDPYVAKEVLEQGKADMIALGRALLADPLWVRKVAEGRPERIRPCIGCYDGCLGRIASGKPLSCAVNPRTGREAAYNRDRKKRPKKVIIAGGGIAGMEAARIARLKGHEVILFEKTNELGGCLIPASVPAFKRDIGNLLQWYLSEMQHLKVDVRMEVAFASSLLQHEKADVLIVATGATPILPVIPGIQKAPVITAPELLSGIHEPGGKVVVVGGGMTGCEIALWTAQHGRSVTIVEMLEGLMMGSLPVPHVTRKMLLDMLHYHKVSFTTNRRLVEVTEGGVVIREEETKKLDFIQADTIVLALGSKPDRTLYNELLGNVSDTYEIGDARVPRNIMGAVWDAHEVMGKI